MAFYCFIINLLFYSAMHDMGGLGLTLQIDPSTRLDEPSHVTGRVVVGGQPVLSSKQCFILYFYFMVSFLFSFDVGGPGVDFCVFIVGGMLFGVSGLLLLLVYYSCATHCCWNNQLPCS